MPPLSSHPSSHPIFQMVRHAFWNHYVLYGYRSPIPPDVRNSVRMWFYFFVNNPEIRIYPWYPGSPSLAWRPAVSVGRDSLVNTTVHSACCFVWAVAMTICLHLAWVNLENFALEDDYDYSDHSASSSGSSWETDSQWDEQ